MNLALLTDEVVSISREVGDYLRKEQSKLSNDKIEVKGYNDFVSYVDQTAERMFAEMLMNLLPESGFLGEEDVIGNVEKELNWIVDPLDGTTNYVHGLPLYCSSIALVKGNKRLLGVINDPNLNECFHAFEDGGAYLNGNRIKVSDTGQLVDSLIATGFPYNDLGKADEYLKVFRAFMSTTRGLRRFGSAAIDLAHVACGRFDGFYEYGLNAWDISAGAIIIEEAGGFVSDFKGLPGFVENKTLLACNSRLQKPMLDIIQTHFR